MCHLTARRPARVGSSPPYFVHDCLSLNRRSCISFSVYGETAIFICSKSSRDYRKPDCTKEGHRQSDEHWNCFKSNVTSKRRVGAHMGFSERRDTMLS